MTPQEHYAQGEELLGVADSGKNMLGPVSFDVMDRAAALATAHFLAAIAGTVLDDVEVVATPGITDSAGAKGGQS